MKYSMASRLSKCFFALKIEHGIDTIQLAFLRKNDVVYYRRNARKTAKRCWNWKLECYSSGERFQVACLKSKISSEELMNPQIFIICQRSWQIRFRKRFHRKTSLMVYPLREALFSRPNNQRLNIPSSRRLCNSLRSVLSRPLILRSLPPGYLSGLSW